MSNKEKKDEIINKLNEYRLSFYNFKHPSNMTLKILKEIDKLNQQLRIIELEEKYPNSSGMYEEYSSCKLIRDIYENEDIIPLEDGCYYVLNKEEGKILQSHDLRKIADELDRLNRYWEGLRSVYDEE